MNELEQAQQNARIMGVLYGLIRGQEINTGNVWYQDWSFDTCLAAHCTHQEFIDACKELLRYSEIVKKYLEFKKEV